jgi:hypothetical protein
LNREDWDKFEKAFQEFEFAFKDKFDKEFRFKEQDWDKFNKAFEKFGEEFKGRYFYSLKKPPEK